MRRTILCLAASFLLLSAAGKSTFALDDFAHNRIPIQETFADQAAVMAHLTDMKTAMLAGQQPNGNFESNSNANDIGDNDWGCVALLAYWWYTNGQNDQAVADAAIAGLDFAIANRDFTVDPQPPAGSGESAATYLLILNSGEHYAKFRLDDTILRGNYAVTAFTLIYKSMILKYGAGLFTQQQLDAVRSQSYSHWYWLTRVSVYDPQVTDNQVMAAVLAGYMLADVENDDALKTEVLDYYNTGISGSNNTIGFRNTRRINIQGYTIFSEKNGFDVHYSGLQLSFMTPLIALLNYDTTSTVYQDAYQQAAYLSARLSESGTIHGGTRHNEVAVGSTTNNAIVPGYNFWSAELDTDLGRAKTFGGPVSTSGTLAQTYGHRAMNMIFLHEYFRPWSTNKAFCSSGPCFRYNDVSVHFDTTNQPQEISVAGTSFSEVIYNGSKAEGLFYQTSAGVWKTDAVISNNYYDETNYYYVRGATGSVSNADINADIKTRYITNGTTLYVITLVRFNGNSTLRSVNAMIGLPNVSTTNRLVKVYDANNTNNLLDLSENTGSLTALGFLTGDVLVEGFPRLRVGNTAGSGNKWMTPANAGGTMQGMISGSPAVYWYRIGLSQYINNTDIMRVNIHDNAVGDSYVNGDVICAVAKISPAGSTETFSVTPTYQSGSGWKVTNVVIDDENMNFDFNWSSADFLDKGTSQTLNLTY